jgi:hypothetical protein
MGSFFGLLLGAIVPTAQPFAANPWSLYEGCYTTVAFNEKIIETKKLSMISQKLSDTPIYDPKDYSRKAETQPSAHLVLAHGEDETIFDAFLTQGEFFFRHEEMSYRFDGWIDTHGPKPTYLSQEIHFTRDREAFNVTIWRWIDGKALPTETYLMHQESCSKPL